MKQFCRIFLVFSILLGLLFNNTCPVSALSPVESKDREFSLQVSPSPLVTTIKPGKATTLDLKIRNGSTGIEELKIEPRGFSVNNTSDTITIDDTSKPAIADWVSFSDPTFTIQPGAWHTQKVTIKPPEAAGFSYSLVLVISRKNNPSPVSGGRLIKGSVAVFTLINIDRPGSTRQLEIPTFATTQKLYEFLPATLKVTFKNTGNSIVQPYGNIFIQRSDDDTIPISTLKVNDNQSYILPETSRTLQADWQDSFPVYQKTVRTDGTAEQHLAWNWDRLSHFRIGKYTAKLVAVYNDGERDIPIQQTITFWVVPWRAILAAIVGLTMVILLTRWRSKRHTEKAVQRALAAQQAANAPQTAEEPHADHKGHSK